MPQPEHVHRSMGFCCSFSMASSLIATGCIFDGVWSMSRHIARQNAESAAKERYCEIYPICATQPTVMKDLFDFR